jgi:hypothetical protein
MTFSIPSGSNDTTAPFTDDVMLDTLTFELSSGTTVFDRTVGGFSTARTFKIDRGRMKFNAEWGDADTDSDGDGTPFQKIGQPDADQETTDPTVQDAAILEVFKTRSLSEMIDGEGAGEGVFTVTFEDSLAFDDVGGNDLADIVFFERGGNDAYTIELIVGRAGGRYVFSDALVTGSTDYWDSGLQTDTVEIDNTQTIHVGGYDFSSFGLGSGDVVSGFRLTATEGNGPDFAGFFLITDDAGSFRPAISPVPLPAGLTLMLGALGCLPLLRAARRRTA